MSTAQLLARLEKVRQVAPNRYVAKCPGHKDKSPSLSIRETEDGKTLLHCFAGCAAPDVLAAVGLTLSDLFPERIGHHAPASHDRKHRHAAIFALKVLHRECLVVAIGAENIAAGVALTDEDRARLTKAATTIRAAAEVCI